MTAAPAPQGASDARDRARRILKEQSAFRACPAVVIDEIMQHAVVVRLQRGEIMYRQGETGDSMMVVLSGTLKVINVTVEGKDVVLGFVKSGALVGEIAAIDGHERTATVVALEPTEAVAIYRRNLLPILRGNPEAMFALLAGLCERLRATNALIESHTLEAGARVADCLVRLARDHGQPSPRGVVIDLKLTQRDLGSHLGLTRETVSRSLGSLRDDGLLEISGTSILILDAGKLAAVAEGDGD